jgi:hypothetical protein
MFEIVSKNSLVSFSQKKDDQILHLVSKSHWENSTYASWLLDNPSKRYITYKMYKECFENKSVNYKVLDVGGGISPLTSLFVQMFKQYDLCEIFAHDKEYVSFFKGTGQLFDTDWHDISTINKQWDLVIANDLFPNVDQRMELFIQKFLPHCKKMRLAVTFYNEPRFYQAQRIDAEEILTYLAYDGRMCFNILSNYKDRIEGFDENGKDMFLLNPNQSVFPNKRHVILLEIKGDL